MCYLSSSVSFNVSISLSSLQLFPSKPHGIDVFSDKVVKIEATSLDQIFDDSDEEEEEVSAA